ncbi:proP, partial [Symbiodinium necroappetens]
MGLRGDFAYLLRRYWSLFLGNVLEWYEFAVYGYLVLFLEDNFFQGSEVATWLGYAATFVARPLGGLVLGLIGDMCGRRTSLTVSIVGMVVGTVGQGLLPSRLSSGQAWGEFGTCMLFVLRIVQGLCTGGEISTVSTYIIEVGSKQTLARSMSLISVSIYIGFLLAQGAVWLVQDQLGPDAMRQWGWRLPFLVAIVPGAFTIAGRRCLHESEEFERDRRVAIEEGHASASYAIRDVLHRGYAIVIAIGGMVSFAVFSYSGLVWTNTFLAKEGLPKDQRMMAGLTARVIQIVLAVPVGWLADVWGVGSVTFFAAAVQLFAAFPLFAWLQADPTNTSVAYAAYAVGFGTIGALGGSTFNMYVTELFPTRTRNLGVGVSYNIGICLVGGFGPVLCSALLKWSRYGPGGLMSLAGVVTCLTVVAGVRLHQSGRVCMAHVRTNPYCRPCADPREDGKPEEQFSLETSESETSEDCTNLKCLRSLHGWPASALMQDSTEDVTLKASSGNPEALRPHHSTPGPGRKGGGRAGNWPPPLPFWQSDEVLGATPWIEVIAPPGRALAQLQVELPRNGRADGYTPEHVQLFVAQE